MCSVWARLQPDFERHEPARREARRRARVPGEESQPCMFFMQMASASPSMPADV